ncbi:MAG: nucleotidyltransferase family protein [Clostridia bacterium]|nr:nucleotidyltransferase family protein [Clostridia bacterium]
MKKAGVICEFNPFHNGHRYLLEQIRAQGFECIICVMSGSFTQRGDVALMDKFSRTRLALKNGADLILELPAPFAVASAQRFAKGGVDILKATGVVDEVIFGSESGDAEAIKKAALATENPEVSRLITEYMDKGYYYPQALEQGVRDVFGSDTADILAYPNNTLGVEYVKELIKADIPFSTVKRKAVEHDSTRVKGEFASASLIREMILKGKDVSDLLPSGDFSNPASTEYGERAIMYKLKSMSLEDFEKLPDVTEGLHNRIFSAVQKCSNLEQLLAEIKTKRYTMARLRRIITSSLLGITKDLQSSPVPYLRVLGMTERGKTALGEIAKKTDLPVITSVASALKSLEKKPREILLCDINATDIRTVFEKKVSQSGLDFTTAMIKE